MTPEKIVGDWFEDALFRDALPHSYDRMVRDVRAAVEAERERIKRIMADDYDACLDFPPKIKLEYFAILRLMELRIDAGDWR